MDTLSALAVKVLFRLISWLPVRIAGGIGAGLGRLGYHLDKRHRNVAHRNLARIYPHRDRKWRQHIARESFAELGRTMLELPHVFLRSKKYLLSRLEIEGEDVFCEAMQQGDGVVITSIHISNWELGAMSFSLLGYPSTQMYRPLRQAGPDRLLKSWRERFGTILHTRTERLRWLYKAMKQGACIGLMVDQHLSNGIPIPFLGHMANSTTLPATLAMKGMPVFSLTFQRLGRDFRFHMQLHPIDIPTPSGDKNADAIEIMRRINKPLEDTIRERPELWLWTHRRWRILEQEPQIAEVVYGAP
ncbi:MAG: lysophospholipid acyltransferase family protein [Mariprofundaceae bacterium]|nr:lysophospholipid acyltransferase family protein [Mariprofundaceae bacterium]